MAIKTYIKASELQQTLVEVKKQGKKIGFVPTMGALHDGHLSLVKALQQQCDYIVVSIFVNPKQFGPNEDFSTYPRMVKSDVEKLTSHGVDAVFLPTAKEMYPEDFQTYLDNKQMGSVLCGQYRDGHFQGVLTVVLKLLNIVGADQAAFGKKDYQQFRLIQKMVDDLHVPVEIIGGDILRENDGLAMSSRNLKLSEQDRATAPKLYQALQKVRSSFQKGERQVNSLQEVFAKALEPSSFQLQYAEILDKNALKSFESGNIDKSAVMAVAAFLGDTRLIDNIELDI